MVSGLNPTGCKWDKSAKRKWMGGGELLDGMGYYFGVLVESVENEDADQLMFSGVILGNTMLSIRCGVRRRRMYGAVRGFVRVGKSLCVMTK
jgi:hypothetical protein